ncbi:hypothetical protein diail_1691 [Diaporthe ilicicola]|nr:hypothetical protein diail_1691 [Diaporthe ilicicola]
MSFQQWGQQSKKRGRDGDDDGDVAIGGTEGFTEHRNKRLQSLPFRTSPTSKKLSFEPSFNSGYTASNPFNTQQPPRTLTPGDSDSEDAKNAGIQQKSSFNNWPSTSPAVTVHNGATGAAFSHAPEMVDGYRTHDVDIDMDMDADDHVQDSAQLSPGHSQPDPMQPGSITSRMPTPIHCSFAAQVRGNNWSGAAGNAVQPSSFAQPPPDRSVPRSLDRNALADWNMVQNRRLPSPISESGGEELGSPRMAMDAQLHPGMPPRAASAMDLSAPARTLSALSIGGDNTGGSTSTCSEHAPSTESSGDHAMDIEAPTGTTPKKGHTRSRHTLNSWTQKGHSHPIEHPVWRQLFGFEIDEGKAFWRAKKEHLAKEWAASRAWDCGEQVADVVGEEGIGHAKSQAVVPFQPPSERRIEPLSDEWFDDLDKSIDEISRLFEEMRVAPPEAEDVSYIQQAEHGLAAIEHDLTNCFTSLEILKQHYSDLDLWTWVHSNGSENPNAAFAIEIRFLLSMPHSVRL